MKRIRNIAIVLSIIIILVILAMLYVNIQASRSFEFLDRSELINNNIRNNISSMNLPVSVLKNISDQPTDDSLRYDRLATAFDANANKLHLNSSNILQQIDNIDTILIRLHPLSASDQRIKVLRQGLDLLKKRMTLMDSQAETLITSDNLYSKIAAKNTFILYTETGNAFNRYYKDFISSSSSLRRQYLLLLNLLTTVIIIAVLLLLIFIFRLVQVYFNYMSHAYDQLDAYDFDVSRLPRIRPIFEEEHGIYNTVQHFFHDQQVINHFKTHISKHYLVEDVLDHLLITTNQLFGVERVGIAFLDRKSNVMTTEYGVATYDKMYLGIGYQSNLATSSLKKLVTEKHGFINNNIIKSYEKKPESESQMLILREGIRSNMSIPVIQDNEVFGIVFLSSKFPDHFHEEQYDLAAKLIHEIRGILNRSYLMKSFMTHITRAFAKLVDERDIETGDHLNRMAQYSKIVASSLQELALKTHPVSTRFILEIERNAPVHDLGKVGTPDSILKKPGRLTDDEYEIMKLHTDTGGQIFHDLNKELSVFSDRFFAIAKEIAKYHHERWDGSGYPEGLADYDIPLSARIVAIADVFDALTSERIYKKAYSFEDSLKIINESSGQHFDPAVVQAFNRKLTEIRAVYESAQADIHSL